jgi:hypothetical protein
MVAVDLLQDAEVRQWLGWAYITAPELKAVA